jgi:hypothetical protein
VARVSLRRRGGKFHAPLGALYRLTSGLGHFYCRQQATLELPAGHYDLIAVRGLEYREYHREFELQAGETNTLTVEMERWTDMAARGWYSGENHVHANYGYGAWYNTPRATLDLCEGEDLNVANIMVANSDGDGVYDREFFRGQPDDRSGPRTIIYWNEEFRSTLWGHLTLVNLQQLVEPIFTGFKDTTNPWDVPTNADIAEQTHVQRAAVSYTHPANNVDSPYDSAYSAKGLPVDAALGRIDTLDVMGWGYDASAALWYRLLNCGFRLPAAAGTDCFLNRIVCAPPGWGRTYVKLTNGLTYRAWIAGQLAGDSFITKGPMLEFSVEGLRPGSTLSADAPRAVRVTARAWSQYPLEKLELIQNSAVVANGELSSDHFTATLERTVRCETTGWLAVRTSGPTPPREVAQFDTAHGPAAHSNPVFIAIRNRPLNAKADAAYFLAWIDRLEQALRQRGRVPSGWEHVEAQLSAARAVYRRIAKEGAGLSR